MCHLLKMMTEREGSQNNTARDDEHDHEVVPVVESVHIHIYGIFHIGYIRYCLLLGLHDSFKCSDILLK